MSTKAAAEKIFEALHDDSMSLAQVNMLFNELVRKVR